MMNRRTFMRWLGLAPAVAVAAVVLPIGPVLWGKPEGMAYCPETSARICEPSDLNDIIWSDPLDLNAWSRHEN